MIGGRKSSAFTAKPRPIAISVFTLFLLTLVLALTYSPGAEAATLEIKFTGTVLQYHFTGETAWWRVLIDQQSLDPPPCSNPIDVLIGGGIPQSGYVDPNIQVGDRVEVYGAEEWGAEWCYIGLPLAHHYIRKIGGGASAAVTFRGEITIVRTMAPFSCVIRVDEVLSGSVTCNYVELGISFGTQGHADWPLNEGDKVEVYGEFDPNHCWVSIDDSPSYYVRLLAHEETYTVGVFVSDALTKIDLPGAYVYVNGTYVGLTDADGNLSLTLPKGQYAFRVTKSGYKPATWNYFIDQGRFFFVELEPEEIPQGKPDLTIVDITWVPGQPTEEDTITINVRIKNQGSKEAGSFYTSLYVDGVYLEKKRLTKLGAGSTATVAFTGGPSKWSWMKQCDKDHTLKAVADSEKQVTESNENNNELSKVILIACTEEPPGSFTGLSFSATCTPDGRIRCTLDYDNQLGEKAQILFIFRKQVTGEVVAHEVVEVDRGTGTTKLYFDCPPNESGVYQVSWKAYKKCDTTSPLPYDCPLWSCARILAQATLRAAVVQYDSNGDGKISDSEKQQVYNDYFKYGLITKDEWCSVVIFNVYNCQPVAWSEPTEEQEVVCPCGGTFTGLEFTGNCIETGEWANHIRCTLRYQNDLGEEALVVFVFKKASTGEIIGKARPYANEGSGQAGALFECPSGEPGTYRLSWEAYRASDIHEQNPVARCEPSDELNIGCPCGSVDIPETTVVLDSSTQQVLTDVTMDEVSFSSSTPLLDLLEPGDIIVCDVTDETPYGLLRNVEGISRLHGGVIVETSQAKLVDAVNQGSISVSQILKASDVVSTSTAPGVEMHLQPKGAQLDYDLSAVLYEQNGLQITTTGSLNISPEFFFDLSIGLGGIEHISYKTVVTEEADLEVKAEVEVSCDYTKELFRHQFAPITVFIGPVPVVLTPLLTVSVSVTGDVTVELSTGVTQEAAFEAGVSYDNGNWSLINDFDNNFDYDTPDVSQECELRGSAKPELGLLIYGLVGPYVNIEGYLDFEADLSEEPWWELWGGLSVHAGVKFDALGYVIGYESPELAGIHVLLAQAEETADQIPPWISIDVGPGDGDTLNDDRVTFEWSGWDNVTNSDDLEFSFWLEEYDDWSEYDDRTSKSYHNLQDKEYTFHLVARDQAGNESDELEVEFEIVTSPDSDDEPPNVRIVSSPGPEVTEGENVTFRWSASDNVTEPSDLKTWYKLDNWDSDWVSTSKEKKTYKDLPEDSYTFRVRAEDEAGNIGVTEFTFQVVVPSEEKISGKFLEVELSATSGKVTASPCWVRNSGTASGRFTVEMLVCGKSNEETDWIGSGHEKPFTGGDTVSVGGLPEDAPTYFVELVLRFTDTWQELDRIEEDVPVEGFGITAFVLGPVDVVLIAPDGTVIDRESAAEYGVVYSETDVDGDGSPDLKVEIPERQIGDYEVQIVPYSDAQPHETYSVTAIVEGEEIVVVEEAAIQEASETIHTFSSPPATRSFWLQPGLNFVSIGIIPERSSPRAVFDELASALEIRMWSSTTETWLTTEAHTLRSIDPLHGYYLWAIDDLRIDVEGLLPGGEQVLRLPSAGWQQISVPYLVAWGLGGGGSVTAEYAGMKKSLAEAVSAGWISGTISQWDSGDKRWIKSTIADGLTLDPWTGYWIYTFVDNLTLRFSETPAMGSEYLTTAKGKEPKTDPPVPTSSPTDTVSIISSKLELDSFIAKPNPFSDEATFTFKGAGIPETFAVTVYNMSGHPVWSKELANVAEIVWNGQNEAGMPLANGPYIYVAMITDGTDTYTGKGKVFIDR